MERNTFINRFEWENQHTSKFWYISLLLRWETIFPRIECESVMHESPAILWPKEQVFCSRQATDKRLECFTVHLIATVDSEFRLLVCGIMDPTAHLPQRRLSESVPSKALRFLDAEPAKMATPGPQRLLIFKTSPRSFSREAAGASS